MKRLLYYLLILALGIFAGEWLAWRQFNGQKRPVKPQADTLVIRDTFVAEKPVYLTRRVMDTVYFPADTVRVRDTLYVPLPVEQRVYGDTRFRAVVSGIRPSLDTISIYESTVIINRVREISLRPRWSIGLQAGVGLTIDGGIRAGPYIGIGIQYNLINFKCQSTKYPAATNGEAPGKSIRQKNKQNGRAEPFTHRDTVKSNHTNQLKNKSYDN